MNGGMAGRVAAGNLSIQGLSVALVDEREIASPFSERSGFSFSRLRRCEGEDLGDYADSMTTY